MTIYQYDCPSQVNKLFSCVADHHRRLFIEYLAEESTPVSLETIVHYFAEHERNEVDQEALTVSMIHATLPMMEEAGIIETENETKTIHTGPRFEAALSLIESVAKDSE